MSESKPEIRKFASGATRDTDKDKLEDIAWAAGFYDGEGSMSCTSNNGKVHARLQLSIGQKDFDNRIADTLLRFQRIVNCGHIYVKTLKGRETNQHQFGVFKALDIIKIIYLLSKHLSLSKRLQARRAFLLFGFEYGDLVCPI